MYELVAITHLFIMKKFNEVKVILWDSEFMGYILIRICYNDIIPPTDAIVE